MLITKTYHDVPSKLDNGRPMRVYIIAPTVPGYPNAKFPGANIANGRALWYSSMITTRTTDCGVRLRRRVLQVSSLRLASRNIHS